MIPKLALKPPAAGQMADARVASGVFPPGRQPVNPGEPVTRGSTVVAMHEAVSELWSKPGLDAVLVRLPPATRDATFGAPGLTSAWVAERHVIAWGRAIWEGPAGRDRVAYERFIDRQVDRSFGRIRRFLLSAASPATLIEKAPAIWKEDHSHGEVAITGLGRNEGTWTLTDHPFTATPHLRASMVEVVRYCVSLTSAKSVTATHALERGAQLVVRLRWE